MALQIWMLAKEPLQQAACLGGGRAVGLPCKGNPSPHPAKGVGDVKDLYAVM